LSENDHLDAAWQYHSGTKHSYQSLRMHPHALDWENKPLLFKIYPTLEVTRLPRDFQDTGSAALSAIAAPSTPVQADTIPDLETLAQLLFFSAGVIRSKKHPQGETFFRAAACTGAISGPPSSVCANSGPAISARPSSTLPAATLLSHTPQ
jgi:hypothetical protein